MTAATLAQQLHRKLFLHGHQGKLYTQGKDDREQFRFLGACKTRSGKVEFYLYSGPYFGTKRIWVGFGAKSAEPIKALKAKYKSAGVTTIALLDWGGDYCLTQKKKNDVLRKKAFLSFEDYSSHPRFWAWFGKYLSDGSGQLDEAFSFLHRVLKLAPPAVQSDDWDGGTDGTATKKIRLQQQRFKSNVLAHWGNKCAVTQCEIVRLLDASHIEAYAENRTVHARTSAENGILLMSHLHRMFDMGLISFSNSGAMRISELLRPADRRKLGIRTGQKISQPFSKEQKVSISKHRKKWGFE